MRCHPRVRAEDLYCGRAFTEAIAAASVFAGPLWVVSAGLGLVQSSDFVPSYNLTITPTSDESIQRRLSSDEFRLDAWWRIVNRKSRNHTPLTTLIHEQLRRRSLMVLALSTQYLYLVAADLRNLSTNVLGKGPYLDSLAAAARPQLSGARLYRVWRQIGRSRFADTGHHWRLCVSYGTTFRGTDLVAST